ncbi:MAG TPA: GGDEF domain-containing protein [Candidatus Polarisedimenticolia bacterium]|nr:GGDEF domain-containing protein [Candidatus Polarisedimenticolia bacterium]
MTGDGTGEARTEQAAQDSAKDLELRILRTALEISRLVEPVQNANGIVAGARALTGASGGLLYLRSADAGEFVLLGSHVGTDDSRRKGLLRLRLEPILGDAGFVHADLEHGASPMIFQALGFQSLISLAGEESDCRCRLLVGFPTAPQESLLHDAGRIVERLLRDCLPGLANSLRMERVRELVIRDDQTDSYNRRYLDSFLTEEVERARRYGTVLSVIFMDLDNLKEINSVHGHAGGSRALRMLSRRVLSAIRGSDKLFRYGGDEFCVLLPETDAVGSYELAERLRQTIAASPFELDTGREVSLTASFGVASFPLHGDSAESIMAAADQAMSRVKLSGKNSIGVGGNPGLGAGAG